MTGFELNGLEGPGLWLLAAALVAAAAVGYAWGRRSGWRQGWQLGQAEAPLSLRGEALVRGTCPVCDRAASVRESPCPSPPLPLPLAPPGNLPGSPSHGCDGPSP